MQAGLARAVRGRLPPRVPLLGRGHPGRRGGRRGDCAPFSFAPGGVAEKVPLPFVAFPRPTSPPSFLFPLPFGVRSRLRSLFVRSRLRSLAFAPGGESSPAFRCVTTADIHRLLSSFPCLSLRFHGRHPPPSVLSQSHCPKVAEWAAAAKRLGTAAGLADRPGTAGTFAELAQWLRLYCGRLVTAGKTVHRRRASFFLHPTRLLSLC